MTHYTKTYTGTKREKYKAALKDMRDYVGKERFQHITDACVRDYLNYKPSARQHIRTVVQCLAIIAGVQGVPAWAFARHTIEVSRTK
jgi:hypothetical protein